MGDGKTCEELDDWKKGMDQTKVCLGNKCISKQLFYLRKTNCIVFFRFCCIYGQFITKQLFIGIRRGEGATSQVNPNPNSIWDRTIRIGK